MRNRIYPNHAEYIKSLVDFRKIKAIKDMSDDEWYYLFKVMKCYASHKAINKFIRERTKENERKSSKETS